MAKFPEPPAPAALARVAPDWRSLPAGAVLWRVYFRAGPHPTAWKDLRWFGPTNSRFDHHPDPPGLYRVGILYAALDGQSPLAEVFQVTRLVDRRTHEPWLVAFELARPVRLLDLMGNWPTRAGASRELSSGPRPRARRWSRAIHAAYPEAQGLSYPSSMNAGKPAVALYERAADAIPRAPVFHRALADPALSGVLLNAAQDLGYGLL